MQSCTTLILALSLSAPSTYNGPGLILGVTMGGTIFIFVVALTILALVLVYITCRHSTSCASDENVKTQSGQFNPFGDFACGAIINSVLITFSSHYSVFNQCGIYGTSAVCV